MSAELQVMHSEDRLEAINQLILSGKYDRMSDFMREAVDEKLSQHGFDLDEYNPNFSLLRFRRFRGNTLLVVQVLQKNPKITVNEIADEVQKKNKKCTSGNVRRILNQLKKYHITAYEMKDSLRNNQSDIKWYSETQHWFLI